MHSITNNLLLQLLNIFAFIVITLILICYYYHDIYINIIECIYYRCASVSYFPLQSVDGIVFCFNNKPYLNNFFQSSPFYVIKKHLILFKKITMKYVIEK